MVRELKQDRRWLAKISSRALITLLYLTVLSGCSEPQPSDSDNSSAQRAPAPIVDTRLNLRRFNTEQPEYGLVSGPDGYYLTRQAGQWGENGKSAILRYSYDDLRPTVPRWADQSVSESDFYYLDDEATACFVSDRQAPEFNGSANIWCMEWNGASWNTPELLPAPVNSSASEYSPVVRPYGEIYFASDREGGAGMGDLYQARKLGEHWLTRSLGERINTAGGEWNLEISPDGSLLLFEASHRESNVSVSGDIYYSTKTSQGWSRAKPVESINTQGSELMPRFIDSGVIVYATQIVDDVNMRKETLERLGISVAPPVPTEPPEQVEL